jgi:hypothetical protein
MLRHHGGEQVRAGFYFNLDSWEVRTVSGPAGGVLDGTAQVRYLRIPALLLLLFAPLMGAAFAIFLPFIGIALVLQYPASQTWRGVRHLADVLVGSVAPAWRPGTAHLTGTPGSPKAPEEAQAKDPAASGRLERLEREVEEGRRDEAPKA